MWDYISIVLLTLQLAAAPAPPLLPFEAAFQGHCGPESPCGQLCREFQDGTFECGCRDGFELDHDGYTCAELEANSTLYTSDNDIEETDEDIFDERITGFSAKLDSNDISSPQIYPKGVKNSLQVLKSSLKGVNTELIDDSLKEVKNEFMKGEKVKEQNGFISLLEDGVSSNDINMIAGIKIDVSSENNVHLSTLKPHYVSLFGKSSHHECTTPFCNHDNTLHWSGNTEVALPVLVGAHRRLRLKIQIRPLASTGPIVLSAQRTDLQGDYFALILREGFLELRFDCGSGPGVVTTSNKVKLGHWNTIIVYRHRNEASIRLNKGSKVKGKSEGLFSRMTFREPVWLGSAGNNSGLKEKLNLTQTFVGCFGYLNINAHVYNISKEAIVLDNVSKCAPIIERCECRNGGVCIPTIGDDFSCVCPLEWSGPTCDKVLDLNVPRFNGSSYLRLLSFIKTTRKQINIQVTLKAYASDGVVIYANGESKYSDSRFIIYLEKFHLNILYHGLDGFMQVSAPRKLKPSIWQVTCISVAPKRLTVRLCLPENPDCCYNEQASNKDEWETNEGKWDQMGNDANNLGQEEETRGRTGIDATNLGSHGNWEFERIAVVIGALPVGVKSAFVNESYDGCVKELLINGDKISMVSPALAGFNVDTCLEECQSTKDSDCSTSKEIVPEYMLISDDLYGRHESIKAKKFHKHKRDGFAKQSSPEIITEATQIENQLYVRAKTIIPRSDLTKTELVKINSERSQMRNKVGKADSERGETGNELEKLYSEWGQTRIDPEAENDEMMLNELKLKSNSEMSEPILEAKQKDKSKINGNLSGQNFYIHVDDDEILKRLSNPVLKINIRFRVPHSAGGLLMRGRMRNYEVTLHIQDGGLVFSYTSMDGLIVIRFNESRVDDGRWHRARAQRSETTSLLEVDGVKARLHEASYRQTNIQNDQPNGIFIGGAPFLPSENMMSLHGCISHVELSGDSDSVTLLTQDTCWNY